MRHSPERRERTWVLYRLRLLLSIQDGHQKTKLVIRTNLRRLARLRFHFFPGGETVQIQHHSGVLLSCRRTRDATPLQTRPQDVQCDVSGVDLLPLLQSTSSV